MNKSKCEFYRISYLEVFCEQNVIKNFAKLTGKYMWRSLFLMKFQVKTCNFFKKKLRHRCFPVNFANFFMKASLQNTVNGCLLLLKIQSTGIASLALWKLAFWAKWPNFEEKNFSDFRADFILSLTCFPNSDLQ